MSTFCCPSEVNPPVPCAHGLCTEKIPSPLSQCPRAPTAPPPPANPATPSVCAAVTDVWALHKAASHRNFTSHQTMLKASIPRREKFISENETVKENISLPAKPNISSEHQAFPSIIIALLANNSSVSCHIPHPVPIILTA